MPPVRNRTARTCATGSHAAPPSHRSSKRIRCPRCQGGAAWVLRGACMRGLRRRVSMGRGGEEHERGATRRGMGCRLIGRQRMRAPRPISLLTSPSDATPRRMHLLSSSSRSTLHHQDGSWVLCEIVPWRVSWGF
ncbi:hypothetical protein JB92DRAFT_3034007 [Gautieria morchelliformis]|nr:hypothetical protein JB92DRAFT_3034007 [Gautieria morchelliformis]